MTIDIQTHAVSGRTLHKYTAANLDDAIRYMREQSAASFVDGYSVGGFGIVSIARWNDGPCYCGADRPEGAPCDHVRWLDGDDFAHGDWTALSEAIRTVLYTLRKREPRTI